MPKIKAPTIAEHVARQERAILDAAGELFASRGLAGTDLSDIAEAVGLARSSLYRYFPDKDHILLAWFGREIPPMVDAGATVLAAAATPSEGVAAWLSHQIDAVAGSTGSLLPRLLGEIAGTALDVRPRIEGTVSTLVYQLEPHVSAALGNSAGSTRSPQLVVELLRGTFVTGAMAIGGGADPAAVKDELGRIAAGLLPPVPATRV